MPDPLEPNDLSHLSDEEFNALCPIGHHASGPEPLSPAAQAVLDAVEDDCIHPDDKHRIAAAALRAAADQVVPAQLGLMHPVAQAEAEAIRADFLAIAAELEGINA